MLEYSHGIRNCMRQLLFFNTLITFALLLGACSQKTSFMQQDQLLSSGNYSQAIKYSQSKIDKADKSARDNLLWELYLGQSYFFNGEAELCISTFDEAEKLMKYHRERILSVDLAKDIGAVLTNDNARPYIGNEYDGIMLNTYKALAYLQEKDYASARVEFNRAIDRQRRAKEFFSASIAKEKDALAKERQNKSGPTDLSDDIESETYQNILKSNYPELSSYKLYPEFVNPATNYLAGLFAMANNDKAKAEFLLKESAKMMSENNTVQKDFAELSQKESEPRVWLIYEEGLAPVLDEMRIDFPVWIFTNQLNYVSVALPRMRERSGSFEYLRIRHDGQDISQTELLSSMERVMQTEFKKRYSSILQRALYSTITKSLMQHRAGDSGNNLLAFSTTLYTLLSTQADTRIWTSLPKNFHLARFKDKGYKSIELYTPEGIKLTTINLIKSKNTLIYVRIPTLAHNVHVSIFSLGGAP